MPLIRKFLNCIIKQEEQRSSYKKCMYFGTCTHTHTHRICLLKREGTEKSVETEGQETPSKGKNKLKSMSRPANCEA